MLVIFHLCIQEKINDSQFPGKRKVLLTVEPKESMLYYAYKLVVHIRLPSRIFWKTLSRDNTIENCMILKILLSFNETSSF